MESLAQLIPMKPKIKNKPLKTLVFCNTVASCRAVHFKLQELYGEPVVLTLTLLWMSKTLGAWLSRRPTARIGYKWRRLG